MDQLKTYVQLVNQALIKIYGVDIESLRECINPTKEGVEWQMASQLGNCLYFSIYQKKQEGLYFTFDFIIGKSLGSFSSQLQSWILNTSFNLNHPTRLATFDDNGHSLLVYQARGNVKFFSEEALTRLLTEMYDYADSLRLEAQRKFNLEAYYVTTDESA